MATWKLLALIASVVPTPVPPSSASLAPDHTPIHHATQCVLGSERPQHVIGQVGILRLRLRGGFLFPSKPKPVSDADVGTAAIKKVAVTFEVVCEMASILQSPIDFI
jgi:hypothetical protein